MNILLLVIFISISEGNGVLKLPGEDELSITYEMILSFATGAPPPPPVGYIITPSIGFHNQGPFPYSNTCSNTLYLPITQPPLSPEKFVYNNLWCMPINFGARCAFMHTIIVFLWGPRCAVFLWDPRCAYMRTFA